MTGAILVVTGLALAQREARPSDPRGTRGQSWVPRVPLAGAFLLLLADSYRETWEEHSLTTEMDRTRAITDTALRTLSAPSSGRPLFLWLHYVRPHTSYTSHAPYDTAVSSIILLAGVPLLLPARN